MEYRDEEMDVLSRAESIVNGILGKVYKRCGQKLLDLSVKDKILTKEDADVAMIAVKTLVGYFAYTDEVDASFFDSKSDFFDYENCELPCGKKIKDCNVLVGTGCKQVKKCKSIHPEIDRI